MKKKLVNIFYTYDYNCSATIFNVASDYYNELLMTKVKSF